MVWTHKRHIYLALMDELWGIFCELFIIKWPWYIKVHCANNASLCILHYAIWTIWWKVLQWYVIKLNVHDPILLKHLLNWSLIMDFLQLNCTFITADLDLCKTHFPPDGYNSKTEGLIFLWSDPSWCMYWVNFGRSFKKWVTTLKFSMLYKNHTFQCMGKIFYVEFQRDPLKFTQNILPNIERCVHVFYLDVKT